MYCTFVCSLSHSCFFVSSHKKVLFQVTERSHFPQKHFNVALTDFFLCLKILISVEFPFFFFSLTSFRSANQGGAAVTLPSPSALQRNFLRVMVNGGNYLSKPAAQVFCGVKSLPVQGLPSPPHLPQVFRCVWAARSPLTRARR